MCIVLYFSPEVNSLLGYHCRLDWGYIHSGRVCSCGICHMQYEIPCAMFHLCLVSFFQFYICISCRIGESTTFLFLSIFYSCLGTRPRVSSSSHRVQKKMSGYKGFSRGAENVSLLCYGPLSLGAHLESGKHTIIDTCQLSGILLDSIPLPITLHMSAP